MNINPSILYLFLLTTTIILATLPVVTNTQRISHDEQMRHKGDDGIFAASTDQLNSTLDDFLATPLLKKEQSITRIAFGSCGKPEIPYDKTWESIGAFKPELWVWLGGNILTCFMLIVP